MKDPKTLFPFLFASSWVGNLFLTVLAFYLAFTHDGPLSPILFLTIAVCILSGNILPIAVYWLLVTWRQAELKAEGAEVAVRVRDALRRSEDILGRLDEAEGSLSKAILVTRQVPERIRESFDEINSLTNRLDTLELTSFVESMATQTESISSMRKDLETTGKHLEKLEQELQGVPKTLEKVLKEAENRVPVEDKEEDDVAMGERMDLVFESLETIQDSLDGLLDRVASLKVPEKPAAEPVAEVEPIMAPVAEKKPRPAKQDEAQAMLAIEHEVQTETTPVEESSSLAKDEVRIVAHAMVGISNKLFIRGDEPWLSWDQGTPMELIGIGEFAWSTDEIKEPLEVSIRLNDEIEAMGGTIKLQPGIVTEVSPGFTH